MIDSKLIELSKYRIEKSEEDLKAAKTLFEDRLLKQAINRAYYSMFHITRALLALKNFDSSKHSGIISFFNQFFVATGKIEPIFHKMLVSAEKIRSNSDYDDFFTVELEQAENQINQAKKYILRIKEEIDKEISNEKIRIDKKD